MNLELLIKQLGERINKLEAQNNEFNGRIEALKLCCCENKMTYLDSVQLFYYDEFGNGLTPEELNLVDRLPGDSCHGAKAVVTYYDATLFCEYWLNDGWIVIAATHGGINS